MKQDKWCGECLNAKWCKYINPYIGFYCPGYEEVIDNKRPLKEPLAADLIAEGYEGFIGKDYKEVINEVADAKTVERGKRRVDILGMPEERFSDLTRKAVAAMAYFKICPENICRALRIARSTFYRMFEDK